MWRCHRLLHHKTRAPQIPLLERPHKYPHWKRAHKYPHGEGLTNISTGKGSPDIPAGKEGEGESCQGGSLAGTSFCHGRKADGINSWLLTQVYCSNKLGVDSQLTTPLKPRVCAHLLQEQFKCSQLSLINELCPSMCIVP